MGFEISPSSITLTGRETQKFELLENGSPVNATFEIVPEGRGTLKGNVYQAAPLIFVSKRITVVAKKEGGGPGDQAAAAVLLSSAHTWIVGLSVFWLLLISTIGWAIVRHWPTQEVSKPPGTVVGPATVTLKPGDSEQFLASSDVNWGAAYPGGVYVAPAAPAAQTPQPAGPAVVNPTAGGKPVPGGTVTVIRSNDISVALSPPYAILKPGEKQSFRVLKLPAPPEQGQNLALQWPTPEFGTLADGVYTAPPAGAIQEPKTILVTVQTTAPQRTAAARVVLLPNGAPPMPLIIIVVLFGALGASLHGVNSLVAYVGNRQFISSWGLWYLARPFVGATLAVLMFLVFRANLVSSLSSPNTADFYAVAALSGLVGLFADKAAKKLEDVLDVLLNPRPDNRADKLATSSAPAPKIDSVNPATFTKGAAATTVAVQGSSFAAGLKAQVNGAARACTVNSATSVTVPLEAADLANAGTLKIKLVSASGAESNEVTVTVS